MTKQVLIIGGGFAGINAARALGDAPNVTVTIVDRQNHHLFQPLLYQVAMAGLSPADIAAPIRSMLAGFENVRVLQGEATRIDGEQRFVEFDFGTLDYDYLIVACGASHSYFGNDDWEPFAPGLKTVAQATEIRRRVLAAFEAAERTDDVDEQKRQLTFAVVGGGPTGVELAGAIGEMSRFTLAKDFKRINPRLTRVILVEAGPRILPMFSEQSASRAMRDLEKLGVQIWTSTKVSHVDDEGVVMGDEKLLAATVLWAAGNEATQLEWTTPVETDSRGRLIVAPDLSLPNLTSVFAAGDQSSFTHQTDRPLPGTAPVAMQQGRFIGQTILHDIAGKPREKFHFVDKGQMATIGRSRAVVEVGKFRFAGWFAWITWLVVHIFYLTGFKNRFFVVLSWAWSYLNFRRGARLIVEKQWQRE
ncbi:MAG: NAD(P)/FAD-dependent oxidoreductase [Planctomycetota bacterium]